MISLIGLALLVIFGPFSIMNRNIFSILLVSLWTTRDLQYVVSNSCDHLEWFIRAQEYNFFLLLPSLLNNSTEPSDATSFNPLKAL